MSDNPVPGLKASVATMIESIENHKRIYLDSGGAQGHLFDSTPLGGPGVVPCLLLTTTGRKSGRARIQPLIYGKTDAGYVIVASRGGAKTNPAWYLNLVEQPEVQVQVATDKFRATARTATGDERARLWKQMVEVYAPYDDYQARTDREIPVVVLERQGD
jgi:deazaflavin-dependent oxidoreductase (nitroreductase family)